MINKKWRVGFDARLAGSQHAGIGRYSEQLLKYLLELPQSRRWQWLVYVRQAKQLAWLNKYSNVEVRVVNIAHYSWQEQLQWWWVLRQDQLDLLHVPHFNVPILYRRPLVVTIHDLLWHQHRDPLATTLQPWVHRFKHLAYRIVSNQAMRQARKIFVPTVVVKKQVEAIISQSSKILVTSEGISADYQQAPLRTKAPVKKTISSLKNKFQQSSYIVYTGSLYPHKNVDLVLQALSAWPNLHLKVVSARNVFTAKMQERAQELGVARQVEWLQNVDDQQLVKLYQKAVALVQPSLAEGFGLTGLEAMAVGCPVIASQTPVFEEVYQDNVNFFNPHSVTELIQVIEQVLTKPPTLKKLQTAQKFARGYEWLAVAEQTGQAYQQVLMKYEK